jgi:hypothetical protein
MKRIYIRKNYSDDKIQITNEYSYTEITLINRYYKVIILYVGENGLSLSQANTILAPFGYELYASTDWTKVEVGSKLKFTDGRVYSKITFKEWIEQTQQVIIFNGNKVEVYNEDEVELA